MQSIVDRTLEERRQWREQKAEFFYRARRRDEKVLERCELGWRNFCTAVHHAVIRHNSMGKPMLGLRRREGMLEIHRAGQLPAVLTLALDREDRQIIYWSPLQEGSAVICWEGGISAAFWGSLLLLDPEGRMVRMRYEEGARWLLGPILQA